MSEPGDRAIDQMLEVFAPQQPFAPEEDRHVPFRLTRRIRRARPWWHWVLAAFSFTLCVYSALMAMQ